MSGSKKDPPQATPGSERLDRAEKRRSDRVPAPPPMGRHSTPFGFGTLTNRGRGSGGQATTNQADFPGSGPASATDWSYKEMLGVATPETIREVEKESRKRSRSGPEWAPDPNPVVKDPDQQRIASGLFTASLAEEQRHRAAPKSFRAGLRAAAVEAEKGSDGNKRARVMFEAFPQGAPKDYRKENDLDFSTGAQAFKPPVSSRVEDLRRAAARKRAGEVLSDSSGDEAD